MKHDLLSRLRGRPSEKILSKESLNHRELIETVSGLDAYANTQEAFFRAYRALGIDLIKRVPIQNAPRPTPPGRTRDHPTKPYQYAHLGVYDTAMRYAYPCATVEDVWKLDVESLAYEDLLDPMPHPYRPDDARARVEAIGEIGLYYPVMYYTVFMWAVEVLGWEIFLLAAAWEPQRFHDHFLAPCAEKTLRMITEVARATDDPFLFLHDDLADARGPVFRPEWYDEFIYPHYRRIFARADELGKKVVFAADGNLTHFLPTLVDLGTVGLFYESPATPLGAVLEHFGRAKRFFIGGIETVKLTFGEPDDVRRMVFELAEACGDRPGFVMSSSGGLHDGIPMPNLEAYFDARAEIGVNGSNWRTACRAG